jgi:hypothetical protein
MRSYKHCKVGDVIRINLSAFPSYKKATVACIYESPKGIQFVLKFGDGAGIEILADALFCKCETDILFIKGCQCKKL